MPATTLPRSDSLRARLLRAVLLPALLVVAGSAVFDYHSTSTLAQQIQDEALLTTAHALAARMSPDEDRESLDELRHHLSPADAELLRANPEDDLHFLVTQPEHQILAGDAALLPLIHPDASPGTPVWADRLLNTRPVRTVTVQRQTRGLLVTVVVSATHHKRQAVTRQIWLHTLWPNVLLLLVMLVLTQRGIAHALRPLQVLSQRIDQRAAQDLAPLTPPQSLSEIQPLVNAINGMLARLQQAVNEQQVFLSSAAHQLRTPLTSIRTQLELAALEAPAPLRPRLDKLHSAVSHLGHCTQQMLALARASANASSAQQFGPVDLVALVEDAASRWLDVALTRQVELCFELAPAQTQGSAWMLQELLGNLIDNATQHSPPHSRVTVRCGLDAHARPWLEVEDQGPGIPPEEREQVFQPYYRSPHSRQPGTGLGLAIVREVAERHQGKIDLGDAQPGLRLRLTLPPLPVDPGIRPDADPGAAPTRSGNSAA